jgi:hypothetical protein
MDRSKKTVNSLFVNTVQLYRNTLKRTVPRKRHADVQFSVMLEVEIQNMPLKAMTMTVG